MNHVNLVLEPQVQDFLSRMQAIFPGAVVAGGYLRDLFLGKQPKDVDVFIPFFPNAEKDIQIVSDSYGHYDLFGYSMPYFYFNELVGARYMPQQEVYKVWDSCYSSEGERINFQFQVIMLNEGLSIENRIHAHDFGICQIYHDGTNCYCTDAFMNDVIGKNFTLVVCEDEEQFNRSMRRWGRFKERYPDYSLKFGPNCWHPHGDWLK